MMESMPIYALARMTSRAAYVNNVSWFDRSIFDVDLEIYQDVSNCSH